jgi:membrane protease YdiL (CAAX protease family)
MHRFHHYILYHFHKSTHEELFYLVSLGMLGIFSALDFALYTAIPLAVLTLMVVIRKKWDFLPIAVFSIVWLLQDYFNIFIPTLYFLIPILAAWLTHQIVKNKIVYFPITFSKATFKAALPVMLAVIGGTTLMLVLWYFSFYDPTRRSVYSIMLQNTHWFVKFIIFIPFLSLVNALIEEVAFRGMIFQTLLKYFHTDVFSHEIALLLQGFWFGASHYLYGFPSGMVGFILASIYGIALGKIYLDSKSLSYPIFTHLFADMVIFYTIVLT